MMAEGGTRHAQGLPRLVPMFVISSPGLVSCQVPFDDLPQRLRLSSINLLGPVLPAVDDGSRPSRTMPRHFREAPRASDSETSGNGPKPL